MRSLLALPLLFLGTPPQPPVGCRVLPQYAPFVVSRSMAPAVDPPSVVHIDVCVCVNEILGYENRIPYQPGIGFFDNISTTVEVAFDPAFTQLIVLPVTLVTPDQVLTGGPWDGATDFGGTSGVTQPNVQRTNVTVDLQVSDPSFFQKPWTVWVRATPDTASFHAHGTGPLSAQRDTMVALGVGATYTP